MNEVTENEERNGRRRRKESQDRFLKISLTPNINEKVAEDEPVKENHADGQPSTDADILMFENEEKCEEGQNTDLETLLAAWWRYKLANKLKKKKKKVLRLYRDENYWTHDRYTDDEDFNSSEF